MKTDELLIVAAGVAVLFMAYRAFRQQPAAGNALYGALPEMYASSTANGQTWNYADSPYGPYGTLF